MSLLRGRSPVFLFRSGVLLAGVALSMAGLQSWAENPEAPAAGSVAMAGFSAPKITVPAMAFSERFKMPAAPCKRSELGSPYIPLDSWMYDSLMRLYSLGFADDAFLGLRPWTRGSVIQMLEDTAAQLEDAPQGPATDEAQELYETLWQELNVDATGPCQQHRGQLRIESVYSQARGITGTPLRDSYHIGESVTNDYGRPYAGGFNNYSGVSGYATAGIFTLYARTEFQYAPSTAGYSESLFEQLSKLDGIPIATNPKQDTIPLGPIGSINNARLVEGYVGAHLAGHEFSFGKQDAWMGVGYGGAFAYTNNAENIYSFRINRTEPLYIPFLSRVTGPFRYDFLVGSLKGHTSYNDPWVHAEKISLKPTPNLEFGFERTVIWGGKGHVPITIHSFLKSFFSISNVSTAEKLSRGDPGARFSVFDMSYRLPFVRNWLTFYTDSISKDDISPVSAPRRASWRPGLYLSHVPGVPKLDLRVEGVTTDQPTSRSNAGHFTYYEGQVPQGYTNAGQIFGDWIGREDKGGQAWITYHLSGNEFVQASWRGQKAAKDFIAGGTTLNDVSGQVIKRLGKELELNGKFTYEQYLAPTYLQGKQTVTTTSFQLTWYPTRKTSF